MIQEARILMRRDGANLLAEPSTIPSRFMFDYLPAVANINVILDNSTRQGLFARIPSYMSYAASINQSVIDGAQPMGLGQSIESVSIVIPRFLYKDKPAIDADKNVQEYFIIGSPNRDANGTYLADAFAHLHLYGIVLVFLVGGIGYGFVTKHLKNNYGIIGTLIIVGLIPIFQPTNDSFAQLFANLRNVLLLLIVIKLVIMVRFSSLFYTSSKPDG
jgi:hypothetical protein